MAQSAKIVSKLSRGGHSRERAPKLSWSAGCLAERLHMQLPASLEVRNVEMHEMESSPYVPVVVVKNKERKFQAHAE